MRREPALAAAALGLTGCRGRRTYDERIRPYAAAANTGARSAVLALVSELRGLSR